MSIAFNSHMSQVRLTWASWIHSTMTFVQVSAGVQGLESSSQGAEASLSNWSKCPKWSICPNQGHAGVDCTMPKNRGLEKGKHVRIASRMLGAKLIELYFRWNDRWVFLAVLFPEVKWRVQHDNIMNTYRALQILEAWNQVICQDYLHARMRDLAGYQPSDENKNSQPLCAGRRKVRLWK